MKTARPLVLTINSGSSTLRFAVFEAGNGTHRVAGGKIDRVGVHGTTFTAHNAHGAPGEVHTLRRYSPRACVDFLVGWLEGRPYFASVKAVGHRIVHGMKHSKPERVTPRLLAELRRLTPYDPEHLPRELELIDAIARRFPRMPQVACFDTSFHRTMPAVARMLAVPRRYASKGVERYGFHGLSYEFLMEELVRIDAGAAKGRVILAHLGNGASMAAVIRGKSVDTSMGFTPASGLVMSTRTGDVDPGLAYYLSRMEHMSAARFQQLANRESGLLGVSGTSSDIRDLLAREAVDTRAAEAIDLFCYQARKWIGSFAAALGGIDTIVFAGGIGENAAPIRERVCKGLGFLGVDLDPKRNRENAAVISRESGRVRVRIIRTDEEIMISRSVSRLLHLH